MAMGIRTFLALVVAAAAVVACGDDDTDPSDFLPNGDGGSDNGDGGDGGGDGDNGGGGDSGGGTTGGLEFEPITAGEAVLVIEGIAVIGGEVTSCEIDSNSFEVDATVDDVVLRAVGIENLAGRWTPLQIQVRHPEDGVLYGAGEGQVGIMGMSMAFVGEFFEPDEDGEAVSVGTGQFLATCP